MSNFEKLRQELKDSNIELSSVLILVKILLDDFNQNKKL